MLCMQRVLVNPRYRQCIIFLSNDDSDKDEVKHLFISRFCRTDEEVFLCSGKRNHFNSLSRGVVLPDPVWYYVINQMVHLCRTPGGLRVHQVRVLPWRWRGGGGFPCRDSITWLSPGLCNASDVQFMMISL